ncbi:MAG TPA: ATP-binding protein, partial [Xanthomonadales bacterium]|nr:ATP-binding protein [Xanthomonadales bacterium]
LSREREHAMQRAALAHVARVGMLAELSGSLAHEINQPLAAILSNAQASQRFIARPEPDIGEVQDGLREIVDNAKRAGEVIRRLRAMLRKEPADFSLLDVNENIRGVLQLLHSEMIERGVVVEANYADGLPRINGDRVQLQQVLLNLIVNAADAMAATQPPRRISVSTRLDRASVLVEVSDLGPGVPEADHERIFQAFVSSKPSGLGFGLALSKTLIEAHGGRIWVSNNADGGACFHVCLPLAG